MPDTILGLFIPLLLLMLAGPAAAVPLAPDSIETPNGATPPAGSVIDGATLPFDLPSGEGGGTVTGTIAWQAIREGSGLLRFEFVLANDAESTRDIQDLGASSYDGYTVNADFDAASSGEVAPIAVSRSPAGRVTFSFGGGELPGIAPGESTKKLYLRTNASDFDTLGELRVRSGPAVQALLAPQPVPEPIALGSVVASLVLLALRRYAQGSKLPKLQTWPSGSRQL
jgi:hypothetical protein